MTGMLPELRCRIDARKGAPEIGFQKEFGPASAIEARRDGHAAAGV